MGIHHLLPARLRRTARRLRQDVRDLRTALTVATRPVARTGALTSAGVFSGAETRSSVARPDVDNPADPHPPHAAAGRVQFVDHDTEVVVQADQTILEAGLQAGLDLDFSCTLGGCAACALQLVDGEVAYDGPNCLSQAERQSGMCLACVGRPNGRIVVASL